jgi:uncharacterized protein (DUF305 family)
MKSHYGSLFVEVLIHFLFMYAVMFTMVDKFDHVYFNLNTFYMTMMMVLPMIPLMVFLMGSMYRNRRINHILSAVSVGLFVLFYLFMRDQAFIGDKQFVRSMIPHHSGAVLMCEKSNIQDAELKLLCEQIVISQEREIQQMKDILARLRTSR